MSIEDTPLYDPVLSPSAVAAWLGVHETTIHRWVRVGTFPPKVRLGPGRVGFARSKVEAWLTENTR